MKFSTMLPFVNEEQRRFVGWEYYSYSPDNNPVGAAVEDLNDMSFHSVSVFVFNNRLIVTGIQVYRRNLFYIVYD